ncbi:protein translocase SEC61 complex, gamma subunit [Methanocaldococcus vulcanius M7]|uniref:Protein translocase subunit SecE n=1 Tax=Methanocaldococcus vulcanius (strain ATCC 700851 / DSM 12094 / M7) TaxID=579137 RepID=C9RGJ0_METVM|nr:protein translocase SEC61 complex subunit gamma [Methanocaldococcus vulcanius]ACX72692.1 protein translocase SEC61 complex, gamma subunit [Methanocaldococcus vulcanius M7]
MRDLNKKIEELKEFLEECKRVWLVLKKPTRDEFLAVAKVTAMGISLLGILGYIIHVPATYIKGILKAKP